MGDIRNRFQVVVLNGGETIKKTFETEKLSVGRSTDMNLVIGHGDVSRHHLTITLKDGQFYVEDHGSSNGTFKNKTRLNANTVYPLENAEHLLLGIKGPVLAVELADESRPAKKVNPILTPTAAEPIVVAPISSNNPSRESEKIVQEARRQADIIIRDAEVAADVKVKSIYNRAHETEKKAEKFYQERLRAAHVDAEKSYQTSKDEAFKFLQDARAQAENMRDEAEEFARNLRQDAENLVADIISMAESQARELKAKRLGEADEIIQRKGEELLKDTRKSVDKQLADTKRRVEADEKLHLEKMASLHAAREKVEKEFAEIDEKYKTLKTAHDKIYDEVVRQDAVLKDLQEREKSWFVDNEKAQQEWVAKAEQTQRDMNAEAEKTEADFISKAQKTERDYVLQAEKTHNEWLEKTEKAKREWEAYSEKVQRETGPLKEQFAKIQSDIEKANITLSTLQSERTQAQREREIQIASFKAQLDEERQRMAKEDKLAADQAKLEIAKSVKQAEKEMWEGLQKKREQLSREILLITEAACKAVVSSDTWIKIELKLEDQIPQVINNSTSAQGVNTGVPVKSIKRSSERMRERLINIAIGSVIGISAIWGYQKMQANLAGGTPMQRLVAGANEAVSQDLERRKFNPTQAFEVRETYVDSVIYTQSFSAVYLDPVFQEQFSKAATLYLLKTWRTSEDQSYKTLAASEALVRELTQRREKIHPDFIKKAIEQMVEVEKASLERIKGFLGTEVKVESFKKFEKKFFEEYRRKQR
ncbi:MAG: FHA domain-containing protein [Bdellovibrionota bacterium]